MMEMSPLAQRNSDEPSGYRNETVLQGLWPEKIVAEDQEPVFPFQAAILAVGVFTVERLEKAADFCRKAIACKRQTKNGFT